MDCRKIYLIRHGERADYAAESLAPKYEVSYDPCLTYCGQVMAHKAGDFLKRTLPPGCKITLLSSPMLRCLETSSIILQTLDLQQPIEVRTNLCEELLPIQYSCNPLPGLLLRTKPYKQIKSDYLRGYDFIDDNIILTYPESLDMTTERFVEQFKKIETLNTQITLVITHGRGVNEFMQHYDPSNKQWNSKYCTISMVEEKAGYGWELKLKDYSEHLNVKYFLMNSECEGEGCPDKVCDYISDCILDACLQANKSCYVNINTILKNNQIFILGETTCTKTINYEEIARNALRSIGYNSTANGINCDDVKITLMITTSLEGKFQKNEQNGVEYLPCNQGTVSGYATNEWDYNTLMPFNHFIATYITKSIDLLRKSLKIQGLLPYCKTQVTMEYRLNGTDLKPVVIKCLAICIQYDHSLEFSKIKEQILDLAVNPSIPSKFIDNATQIVINSLETPVCMLTGMTGRKVISDTYGGWGRNVCGSYSGKCPSKLERAGSYFCRFIAKNLVFKQYCSRALVQLTYVGNTLEPISINVYSYGTVDYELTDRKLAKMIQRKYCLELPSIIKLFKLERPIYSKTSVYGHYGRLDPDFTWEDTEHFSLIRTDSF